MQSQLTPVENRTLRAFRSIMHWATDKATKGLMMWADALAAVRRILTACLIRVHSQHRVVRLGIYTATGTAGLVLICAAALLVADINHIYFDRNDLPDMEAFTRFEFPTIGH